MIGRAMFGNPWIFAPLRDGSAAPRQPTIAQRLQALLEHTAWFDKLVGKRKSFAWMVKNYKAYCSGFRGSKDLRLLLHPLRSADLVPKAMAQWLESHGDPELRASVDLAWPPRVVAEDCEPMAWAHKFDATPASAIPPELLTEPPLKPL